MRNYIKFEAVVDVSNCLKQNEYTKLTPACTLYSELPSHKNKKDKLSIGAKEMTQRDNQAKNLWQQDKIIGKGKEVCNMTL